jgi:hypothetical protein
MISMLRTVMYEYFTPLTAVSITLWRQQSRRVNVTADLWLAMSLTHVQTDVPRESEPTTYDVIECHSPLGGGNRTDQSESAACHLSTLPIPSHWPLQWHSGTEVVTSGSRLFDKKKYPKACKHDFTTHLT